MADWNSEQYLKFEKQRTQPSVDLVNRLRDLSPKKSQIWGAGPETARRFCTGHSPRLNWWELTAHPI